MPHNRWMVPWFAGLICGTLCILLLLDAHRYAVTFVLFLVTLSFFYLAWRWCK